MASTPIDLTLRSETGTSPITQAQFDANLTTIQNAINAMLGRLDALEAGGGGGGGGGLTFAQLHKSGAGTPSVNADFVGQWYRNTSNGALYRAVATGSSPAANDWLYDPVIATTDATAGQYLRYVGSASPPVWSDFSNFLIKAHREHIATSTISAGALSINMANGNVHQVALSANVTSISITNVPASGTLAALTLWFTQDSTGGRVVTWPASIDFGEAGSPAVAPRASNETIIVLLSKNGGTSWRAMLGYKSEYV